MSKNIIEKLIYPGPRGRSWRIFIPIFIVVIAAGIFSAGDLYNRGADYLAAKTGQAVSLPRIQATPFRLGLDLQGGTHLVYEADMSQIPDQDKTSALEGVRDVIERRVNVFGVSEPIVQTSSAGDDHRVIVELAGIKDVNEAIAMIGETPLLEFKEESTEERELTAEEREQMDEFNRDADERAEELLGKLLSGGVFAELAREYNFDQNLKESGGDLGWVSEAQEPEAVAIVRDWAPNTASSELIDTQRGYDLYYLEDKRFKANPFDENEIEKEVKASHLLICHEEIEGCDAGLSRDEAYALIKDLQERANPANFAALVREHTTEPGGAERDGDLGWFGKGMMVKPFEDTVFVQETGTISWVVETQFGYHLIYKEAERNIEEFKIRRVNIPKITEEDILGMDRSWQNTDLSGKHLKRSVISFNPNDNSPEVSLEFDSEGASLFEEITGRNVGRPVAIFLDGSIISAPNVNEKIGGGKAVISGGFNIQEAKLLAQRLNAGALPVPIDLVSQQTVGASLGQESLVMSLKAGILGLILVAVFMIVVYRLPGFLAVLSLLAYGALILAIFKLWPVTLTLSGLAGFILSIGLAVDANVLIFERLKEELKTGKPLDLAVEDAFDRAWPSIRDGNVSTLITCFILIQFTTSVVKGFAVTLGLGVLISMFSAIVITKTLLKLAAGDRLEKYLWLLGAPARIKN